jgi:drug/metabolite transporter (DMT)-like permease
MKPTRGILLMIGAVTIFVIMTAMIKAAVRVPAGQAVFFRSFWAMPVILIWLWSRDELRTGLKTQNWRSHAVRGIAGSCAMGLGFAGLKFLPLPEVTALRFVTPILMVVLAALILGERLRIIRISAVLLGLVGVIIIMWPRLSFDGGQAEMFGVAIVLASAGLAALAQVFIKGMAGTERTSAIVFYFSLTATTLSLFSIPFGWVWPTSEELVLLIGAGLIGGLGQICLTASYRFADASVLAPFTYVSMIWALLIGYFVFAEVPTAPMLAGAALIILSGVVIALRERQLGLRQTSERKVRIVG